MSTVPATTSGTWPAANAAPRRGIALLMVLGVIGLAAVLGWAMLSASALQQRLSGNLGRSGTAQSLADSGLNVAAFYLANPAKAPSLNAEGFWPGAAPLSFGNGAGSANVTVTQPRPWVYRISSTGISPDGAQSAQRTASAEVHVRFAAHQKRLAAFSAGVTLPGCVTIGGDVQVNGLLTNAAKIDGVPYVGQIVNTGQLKFPAVTLTAQTTLAVPGPSQVNTYRTYAFNGVVYQAAQITTETLGGAAAVTLAPSSANPAGIHYFAPSSFKTLTLNGNVTINGALVVENAHLLVSGINNVITAENGFPALVAMNDVRVDGKTKSLVVNGVAWVGGWVRPIGDTTKSSLTFNGALLFGNGGSVDATFSGAVAVNVLNQPEKINVTSLDRTLAYPNVRVLAWQQ